MFMRMSLVYLCVIGYSDRNMHIERAFIEDKPNGIAKSTET